MEGVQLKPPEQFHIKRPDGWTGGNANLNSTMWLQDLLRAKKSDRSARCSIASAKMRKMFFHPQTSRLRKGRNTMRLYRNLMHSSLCGETPSLKEQDLIVVVSSTENQRSSTSQHYTL